jgi:hypothetical protein
LRFAFSRKNSVTEPTNRSAGLVVRNVVIFYAVRDSKSDNFIPYSGLSDGKDELVTAPKGVGVRGERLWMSAWAYVYTNAPVMN